MNCTWRREVSPLIPFLLAITVFQTFASIAHAEVHRGPEYEIPVAIRFTAIAANAPPGACGCFWLKGGAVDAAVPVFSRFSAAAEVTGATADRVPGSSRGLSQITLMAGPRYTLTRHTVQVSLHALFGAVHGFDADFPADSHRTDTSTSFAMASGGALELRLTRHMGLRAAEIDYLQTNLPNGADDRQRNIRVGAGLVFHLAIPARR